jgi:hypothetical protein
MRFKDFFYNTFIKTNRIISESSDNLDAAYYRSIDDVDTLADMVAVVAKQNGYNIGPVGHGTNKEFNVFRSTMIGSNTDPGFFGRGFYFAPIDVAARWGTYTKKCYLKINKPFRVNSMSDWTAKTGQRSTNDSKKSAAENKKLFDVEITRITDDLLEQGYDGCIRIDTNGVEWPIVFYPFSKNIKLADPITYDDEGGVISLSNRFDTTNSDIRY